MQRPQRFPNQYGLPAHAQLETFSIWDSYFTPSLNDPLGIIKEIEQTWPTLEKAHFRRMCLFLHVGLGTADPTTEARLRSAPELISAPLDRWPDKLLGLIQLNANNVSASLSAIDRWLGDGPMLGVYFPGGSRGSLTCTHPNYGPLIEKIASYGGLIMQHTWFKTGGKESPGESTPAELAELAQRYPKVNFVCAHAGGEWEKGIRAVRALPNICVETSGFDPTAGFVEMAVRELGASRIVFGSHLPSRSLGTELAKVTAAQISLRDKQLILGENLRTLLTPIMRRKGLPIN